MRQYGTLSIESLNALYDALGLADTVEDSKNVELLSNSQDCAQISTNTGTDTFHLRRSTTPSCRLNHRDSIADEARIFGQAFLSDFEISDHEYNEHSVLDTLPSRPGSSIDSFDYVPPIMAARPHPLPFFFRTPRLRESAPFTSDSVTIKAAHNASIIMLRVARDIPFLDLKRRLHNKFVNQEGHLLSLWFSVVLVLPSLSSSGSPSAPTRKRVSLADRTEMRFLNCEADWRRTTSTNDGSKITLRILDTPP
ncbi:hypothetical protein B0H34DRAFT_149015 [Crassisporium funariophilum]|nr:hypothetical protein B0H34DRAFT_149015 [Crassisporium funariophilum]